MELARLATNSHVQIYGHCLRCEHRNALASSARSCMCAAYASTHNRTDAQVLLLCTILGGTGCGTHRYDVATISSVIPAFAKGKDVIVCDSGVSYPIELGISLSRCQVPVAHCRDSFICLA